MIQASLLDLVAQNKLTIDNDSKTFTLRKKASFTPEEDALLTFVFGKRSSSTLTFDRMFADYRFGKTNDSDQAEKILDRYHKRLKKLDRAVAESIQPRTSPQRKRSGKNRANDSQQRGLTLMDRVSLWLAIIMVVIGLTFSGLLTPALYFTNLPMISWINGPIFLLACFSFLKIFTRFNPWRLGIVTVVTFYGAVQVSDKYLGEIDATIGALLVMVALVVIFIIVNRGSNFTEIKLAKKSDQMVEARKGWDSFENTLRDIKRFDKAEFESLVIWDRILVYASLFGYAERVRNYMKQEGIEVNSLNLPQAMSESFNSNITNHYSSLSSSTTGASESLSFTTGDTSGGFSGGGGGGGGGAF